MPETSARPGEQDDRSALFRACGKSSVYSNTVHFQRRCGPGGPISGLRRNERHNVSLVL